MENVPLTCKQTVSSSLLPLKNPPLTQPRLLMGFSLLLSDSKRAAFIRTLISLMNINLKNKQPHADATLVNLIT